MFNIHNLSRQRSFLKTRNQQKYCAVIKGDKNEHCSPWGYHCMHGLTCKKVQKQQINLAKGGGGRRPNGGGGRRPNGGGGRRPNGGGGRRPNGGRQPNGGRGQFGVSLNSGRGRQNGGQFGRPNRGQFGRPNGGQFGRRNNRFVGRRKRQLDYHYSDEYEPDYHNTQDTIKPLDLEELFGMKLPNKKLIEKIEGQFKNHQCVKHVSDGSGESCTTSVECRCGEFCSKQGRGPGKCQPATCSLGNSGVCNAYPGFNHK